ncbi:MAG: hypothetical protein ACJ72H_30660 [Candidatus Sulfotelmatobacter sp.]
MRLFLILASVGYGISSMVGGATVPTKERESPTGQLQYSGATLCMHVTMPDSLPGLADYYIDENTFLRLRDELAPAIGDTTKLPGHPRSALQVESTHVPAPDYAAWWPLSADSLALYWRFGLGRGIYVAAGIGDEGDLSGRLFLSVRGRHEGPIAFGAKRVACTMPLAA